MEFCYKGGVALRRISKPLVNSRTTNEDSKLSADNICLRDEKATKTTKPPKYDLARLKWVDPCSDSRFTRKNPVITKGALTEAVIQNIVRLADELFGRLSVFEQFPEATSRGAVADPKKKMDFPHLRAKLRKAELELWDVYCHLEKARKRFIDTQLKSLGIDNSVKGLKVHIGSGGYLLKGWLNIDAGGGDLTLNANWGLPLPDACAKFVYSAHLVEHLRYTDQAPVFVRDVHRILAKGGIVRFVVPDMRKLLAAYIKNNREFFRARARFYPLSRGFMNKGVANLDYILLFAGASSQVLNYNHKFGYDFTTLRNLLINAGFRRVTESMFQGSAHPELRVDRFSYNALAKNSSDHHYSLFVEAAK